MLQRIYTNSAYYIYNYKQTERKQQTSTNHNGFCRSRDSEIDLGIEHVLIWVDFRSRFRMTHVKFRKSVPITDIENWPRVSSTLLLIGGVFCALATLVRAGFNSTYGVMAYFYLRLERRKLLRKRIHGSHACNLHRVLSSRCVVLESIMQNNIKKNSIFITRIYYYKLPINKAVNK